MKWPWQRQKDPPDHRLRLVAESGSCVVCGFTIHSQRIIIGEQVWLCADTKACTERWSLRHKT